jgi:hypothetical protein
VEDFRRCHNLPGMPLSVLRGMKQQAQHCGRQTGTAHAARFVQRPDGRLADLIERAIDGLVGLAKQCGWFFVRSRGFRFGFHGRLLGFGESLTARICQESVEAARKMSQVKSNRCRTTRP